MIRHVFDTLLRKKRCVLMHSQHSTGKEVAGVLIAGAAAGAGGFLFGKHFAKQGMKSRLQEAQLRHDRESSDQTNWHARELVEAVEDANLRVRTATERERQAQAKSHESNVAVRALQSEMQGSDDTFSALHRQLSHSVAEGRKLKEDLQAATTDGASREELHQRFVRLEANLSEQVSAVRQLTLEISRLQAEISRLQAELQEKTDQVATLNEQHGARDIQIRTLEEERATHTSATSSAQAALEVATAEVQRMTEQLALVQSQSREEAIRLGSRLREMEQELSRHTLREEGELQVEKPMSIKNLRDENTALQAQVTRLRARLQSMSTT